MLEDKTLAKRISFMIADDKKRQIEYFLYQATDNNGCLNFCQSESDPHALHFFARNWNYDSGIDPLKRLVKNPACDQATALMIYWACEPEHYYRIDYKTECQGAQQIYEFMKEIEDRFLRGEFSGPVISFDPVGNKHRRARLKKTYKVPAKMLDSIVAMTERHEGA